jgi:hypothetical protein
MKYKNGVLEVLEFYDTRRMCISGADPRLKINSLDAISWHLTTTFAAIGMISRHRKMMRGQFFWGVGEK